jgi:hypothetical protein
MWWCLLALDPPPVVFGHTAAGWSHLAPASKYIHGAFRNSQPARKQDGSAMVAPTYQGRSSPKKQPCPFGDHSIILHSTTASQGQPCGSALVPARALEAGKVGSGASAATKSATTILLSRFMGQAGARSVSPPAGHAQKNESPCKSDGSENAARDVASVAWTVPLRLTVTARLKPR